MAGLLIVKLLIPYVIVAGAFAVAEENGMPPNSYGADKPTLPATVSTPAADTTASVVHFKLLAFVALWSLTFLLLIRTEGSWKEIGNSISSYIVASATCLLVPVVVWLGSHVVKQ